MIDLCFSQSVQGALRIAQHSDRIIGRGTAMGVVYSSGDRPPTQEEQAAYLEKARAEQEWRASRTVPLGGNFHDVLALPLGLDRGDIAAPIREKCPRQELLRKWLTTDIWGSPEEAEEQAREHWAKCLHDLEELQRRAATEPVRIWVDNTPDSRCGLLFAASILAKIDTAEVFMMPLPEFAEGYGGTVIQYSGWGDVHPEELGLYLNSAVPLPQNALRALASQWRQLREENAPVRAYINGYVMSVEEDFYDHLIRRELPEEGTIKVAQLIGNVLGRRRPGIGDGILADRIRWMLSTGELRMVEESSEMFYQSVIEKA